jgi:hypothetical protein
MPRGGFNDLDAADITDLDPIFIASTWLRFVHGTSRTCQELVLLVGVLSVTVQGSRSPGVLQKDRGKD